MTFLLRVCTGGKTDEKDMYIEPTILINVSPEDKSMQEEVIALFFFFFFLFSSFFFYVPLVLLYREIVHWKFSFIDLWAGIANCSDLKSGRGHRLHQ